MRHALPLLLLSGCVGHPPEEFPWARDAVAHAPEPGRPPAPRGPLPIDLPTVLRLAGASNLDVAYVREKIHEAYARAEMAEERFWPTLGPELGFRRHDGLTQATDGAFVDVDKQQAFAGARARLRWDVGEAVFAALGAARRFEGANRAAESAERAVQLEAALAYYDLVREHLRSRVAGESAGVSAKLADELAVSVEAGRGFRGDVLRARVQLASSRLHQLRAREAIGLASIRLSALLRLPPGTELAPAEPEPAPLELVSPQADEAALLREAWSARPEVREAEHELAARRLERSAASWAPLLPALEAEAAPGRLGEVPSDFESTEDYAVTLGWRIGPGGLFDLGRRRLADSLARQAEIHLERVRQKVGEQALAALARLRAKDEQRKLAAEAVRDAAESLRLNQERQAANIGLPLEVLQAEEALTRARLDLFTAVVDYNQEQIRAHLLLGRPPPAR